MDKDTLSELLRFKYALHAEYQRYHDNALGQPQKPSTYENWLENRYFAELREKQQIDQLPSIKGGT